MGGRKTRKTRSGLSVTVGRPGNTPRINPPMTRRMGYGIRILLATVVRARTAASRRMTISSWCKLSIPQATGRGNRSQQPEGTDQPQRVSATPHRSLFDRRNKWTVRGQAQRSNKDSRRLWRKQSRYDLPI